MFLEMDEEDLAESEELGLDVSARYADYFVLVFPSGSGSLLLSALDRLATDSAGHGRKGRGLETLSCVGALSY